MRKANPHKLQAIYDAVSRTPGARPAQIARQLGIARSTVTRALPSLERAGLLLSEDRRGRLWPWK